MVDDRCFGGHTLRARWALKVGLGSCEGRHSDASEGGAVEFAWVAMMVPVACGMVAGVILGDNRPSSRQQSAMV